MDFFRNLFSIKNRRNDPDRDLQAKPDHENTGEHSTPTQSTMKGVNSYWKELTHDDIVKGAHRMKIGGLWKEVGKLQFDFLLSQGLLPEHRFLDVGCGSLRGGIHFVPYLIQGNYFGLDINESLIEAGRIELAKINSLDKQPKLLVNDKFEFSKFGVQMDFALAFSVFTHLYGNHIGRCLVEIKKVLKPKGIFFATFFQAPYPAHLSNIKQEPGGLTTNYDSDPFHYSLEEIQFLARNAGLTAALVDNWEHPRGQKMISFRGKPTG